MKRRITKEEAKKIWVQIVEENMSDPFCGIDLSENRNKLLRIRFTYYGKMVERLRNSSRMDPYYAYATKHYSSLLKKFKEKMEKEIRDKNETS